MLDTHLVRTGHIYIYIWKIKCVEKVVVLYIFLDNVSCEEFAM